MSWTLLVGSALALGVSFALCVLRRSELRRMRRSIARRTLAVREGRAQADLSQAIIDLTRCLGCGTRVVAAPRGRARRRPRAGARHPRRELQGHRRLRAHPPSPGGGERVHDLS